MLNNLAYLTPASGGSTDPGLLGSIGLEELWVLGAGIVDVSTGVAGGAGGCGITLSAIAFWVETLDNVCPVFTGGVYSAGGVL
jgi:hypothetical protein